MGEILPKLTDEITKLNSQGISHQYLKFIPYHQQPSEMFGACWWVKRRSGFEIRHRKVGTMVNMALALEPGRLGPKS